MSRALASCVAALALFVGCARKEGVPKVVLADEEESESPGPGGGELVFSLPPRLSPGRAFAKYRAVIELAAQGVGMSARIVSRATYGEVISLLEHRDIDVAFMCAGSYVDARENFGAEILVVPVIAGKTTDRACILARADGPITRWEDLRGRSFAFTDPESNAGKLRPAYLLASHGFSPKTFFSRAIYSHGHENSVKAVASGLVDGAAVHCNVLNDLPADDAGLAGRVKVVWRSPPHAMPPIVVHPGLEPALKEGLRWALLSMHRSPAGAGALRRAGIDRFEVIADSAYDEVRRMRAAVTSP